MVERDWTREEGWLWKGMCGADWLMSQVSQAGREGQREVTCFLRLAASLWMLGPSLQYPPCYLWGARGGVSLAEGQKRQELVQLGGGPVSLKGLQGQLVESIGHRHQSPRRVSPSKVKSRLAF